jgi:hypothetical protein
MILVHPARHLLRPKLAQLKPYASYRRACASAGT